MATPKALPSQKLRARLLPERIGYADSTEIPSTQTAPPMQPRALHALELGLNISKKEYNIFVVGEPQLGRTYLVQNFLLPRAAQRNTPPDWIYVYNFEDPDRPLAVSLPSGSAKGFKTELTAVVNRIRDEVPNRFAQDQYLRQKEKLVRQFQNSKEELILQMEEQADDHGFNVSFDEQGNVNLFPVVDGKVLNSGEVEKLDTGTRQKLRNEGDKTLDAMLGLLRQINAQEQALREAERILEREVLEQVLLEALDPFTAQYASHERLHGFLTALRADLLDNLDQFKLKESASQVSGPDVMVSADAFFERYTVNLFVDNSRLDGAPIIIEDNPTFFNLLGCIEREAEWGALFTDFSLLKAGALHRANGGFLVLHIEDVLQHPQAWEGLLRALRSMQIRIEDPGDHHETIRTKTITPEPIALQVKVILVGTDEAYDLLQAYDDRFAKLFKIKGQIQDTVTRTADSIRKYVQTMGRVIREDDLLPFDREALAWLVDYASRLAEDQKKLSLRLPIVREVMIEASAMGSMRRAPMVNRPLLEEAWEARNYRANLYEEEFLSEYDRQLIKVATTGSAVGQANGLSVTFLGDYELGLPHQISCSVGVGHGGIIDLEREAELGGPIHTKGMMILKSYLLKLFAQNKPVVLNASLCFEQSYAQVDGDSASGAELAALISALSGHPNNLALAFTGAVSQSGAIMAVGGVTRKVEGFFEVCRRRGLTGEQGVILPEDNVVHLMLKQDVVQAVEEGQFHIYPVCCIEQALEILTGLPAGRRLRNGSFSAGSLYRLADDRLKELEELATRDSSARKSRQRTTKASKATKAPVPSPGSAVQRR
ncbi:Lon protease family protein [Desulfonatronum thioautotrophicum]|uniref:Lon protease family protein n=1 Tax=Desulfonatronum thioautotrophicum TaxID=617001 RepID=UPI000A01D4BE|nr:ATP-binding protein [Desulfonatronum thioautotrophicum]